MSNVYRCKRCDDTFIAEEFDNHVCTPNFKDFRNFQFDYYYFTKDNTGRETIMIKGMDGILYSFTKREYSEHDKIPISDESLQADKSKRSNGDFTEPKKEILIRFLLVRRKVPSIWKR
jgi:hypothetical protein